MNNDVEHEWEKEAHLLLERWQAWTRTIDWNTFYEWFFSDTMIHQTEMDEGHRNLIVDIVEADHLYAEVRTWSEFKTVLKHSLRVAGLRPFQIDRALITARRMWDDYRADDRLRTDIIVKGGTPQKMPEDYPGFGGAT